MKTVPLLTTVMLAALPLLAAPTSPAQAESLDEALARGRYLVTVSGCNDCHTPGYMQSHGEIAERDWLIGGTVGFQGAWGTTYPSNLRLLAAQMDESQWLARTATPLRPPMPWFALSKMTADDRRAIWRYIRSLGPSGSPAPDYVGPGQTPLTPVIVFEPVAPRTVGAPLASAALE
ncbi:MAG TPA: cytochrome c [Gammaproteobacteria bacterium]|nr:cytochrome c [Gammaproteobacteria bacterium]